MLAKTSNINLHLSSEAAAPASEPGLVIRIVGGGYHSVCQFHAAYVCYAGLWVFGIAREMLGGEAALTARLLLLWPFSLVRPLSPISPPAPHPLPPSQISPPSPIPQPSH